MRWHSSDSLTLIRIHTHARTHLLCDLMFTPTTGVNILCWGYMLNFSLTCIQIHNCLKDKRQFYHHIPHIFWLCMTFFLPWNKIDVWQKVWAVQWKWIMIYISKLQKGQICLLVLHSIIHHPLFKVWKWTAWTFCLTSLVLPRIT